MTNKQVLKYYGSWPEIQKKFGVSRQVTSYWNKIGRVPDAWQIAFQKDSKGKLRASK